ncbi:MAG: hypothetical protein NZ899_10620 [Thermoguttaceae bacterium]|nr:hypothetical protein [Thermoguttaceae bacterium]MDW8078921.1 hypothetical protein [Thermoguttaceae bacterium]
MALSQSIGGSDRLGGRVTVVSDGKTVGEDRPISKRVRPSFEEWLAIAVQKQNEIL